MILADASIWIEHFRVPNESLLRLLSHNEIACHDFVIGEVSLGHVRNRDALLDELFELPKSDHIGNDEVLALILQHKLFGKGIGYVDVHLLASAILTSDCSLWTRDRNLLAVARGLHVEAQVG
jgi:predicted nucleic acid-binding protein